MVLVYSAQRTVSNVHEETFKTGGNPSLYIWLLLWWTFFTFPGDAVNQLGRIISRNLRENWHSDANWPPRESNEINLISLKWDLSWPISVNVVLIGLLIAPTQTKHMQQSIKLYESSPDRGLGRGANLTVRGAACGIADWCVSVGQYFKSRAASTDGDEGTIMSITPPLLMLGNLLTYSASLCLLKVLRSHFY